MKDRRAALSSLAFWPMAACLVWILVGCEKKTAESSSAWPESGPRLARSGVELHLSEYLPAAETYGEMKRLVPGMPGGERFFTAGWNKAEVSETSESFAWTTTRDAVIDIPRIVPGDLSLVLDLAPHPAGPTLPPLNLAFAWNGDPVTSQTLGIGRQKVELSIPASRQLHGINRLEILPGYWVRPRLLGMGSDNRDLGVRCFGIDLRSPGASVGPGTLPSAEAIGDSIRQAPGSAVAFHFVIPANARLIGEATLHTGDERPAPPFEGQIEIFLRDSGGKESSILSWPLAEALKNPSMKIDADLSGLAQRMAGLTLGFWVKHPSAEPSPWMDQLSLEWKGLRIEGEKEDLVSEGVEKLRGRYNILLILFDSLRADHTEPYGAREPKTPEIAKLASGGVTFVNARSAAAFTHLSVATMLTSAWPDTIGMEGFGDLLRPDFAYLPEILKNEGYRTMAVFNNGVLHSKVGFGRGFDQVHEYFRIHDQKRARAYKTPEDHAGFVWSKYVDPCLKEAGKDPFFIYLHEIDPHIPYTPMPPFDTMYDAGSPGVLQQDPLRVTQFLQAVQGMFRPQDIAQLHALYMGEITYMDRYLGFIMEKLRQRQLENNTLVIFVGDHGEEFFEHGKLGHNLQVTEEMLRVPFILSLGGVLPPGRRPLYDVQLTDLAPTILDLLGEKAPAGMRGRSLLPVLLAPEGYRPPREFHAQTIVKGSDITGYGHWKLTRHNGVAPNEFPPFGYELYDLERDPGERVDRWPREIVVGYTLRQMMKWQKIFDLRSGAASPAKVKREETDPEVLKNLRALGYIN